MLGYSRETTYSNLGYLSSLSLFGLLENRRLGWYGWADQISPAEATERLVDQDKPGRRSPIQPQPFKSASPSSGYSSNQPAQPISQSKSANRTAPLAFWVMVQTSYILIHPKFGPIDDWNPCHAGSSFTQT